MKKATVNVAASSVSLMDLSRDQLMLLALCTVAVAAVLVWLLGRRSGGGKGEDKSVGLRRAEANSSSGNLTAMDDDRVLNPLKFRAFKVVSSTQVSHNTKLIRFAIPGDRPLGLPIGRHIALRAEIDGNQVIRSYTPTSRSDTKGYFELLIKSYEYGKLSPHLHALKVGGTADVRGPVGRFRWEKNKYPVVGLIAGGTGLTPCLQVIRCILQGPEGEGDTTKFVLLFQNRTENDILLRRELEDLQSEFSSRLHVVFFLSNCADAAWGMSSSGGGVLAIGHPSASGSGKVQHVRGYIDTQAISTLLSPSGRGAGAGAGAGCSYVGLCGPSGFNEAMKGLLEAAGHNDESIHIF